jgi:serine/threonine protein kinase
MGHVYKAFDPRLHREIAIKVAAERFSQRFDREVRAIATLNHPNICTIHDVGPNYLVTELVAEKRCGTGSGARFPSNATSRLPGRCSRLFAQRIMPTSSIAT